MTDITPQELKLLKYLSQNPERVLSRDQLLSDVWGYTSYPSTRTVDSHILNLRQKLEKIADARDARDPDAVHLEAEHLDKAFGTLWHEFLGPGSVHTMHVRADEVRQKFYVTCRLRQPVVKRVTVSAPWENK